MNRRIIEISYASRLLPGRRRIHPGLGIAGLWKSFYELNTLNAGSLLMRSILFPHGADRESRI
jgi:hypothetical protein